MLKQKLFAIVLGALSFIPMAEISEADSFLDYNKTLKDLQKELQPYNELIVGDMFYNIDTMYRGNRVYTNNQNNMVISTFDYSDKLFLYDFQAVMRSRQIRIQKGKKGKSKLYHIHKSKNNNCLYFIDKTVEYILLKKIKYTTTQVGRHGSVSDYQIKRNCGGY